MTRPVRRGFPYYGIDLGIVLVDSGIPRPVGDVGHARTWPFPVGFRVADGARPADMSGPWTRGSIDAFHSAGESLARDGVKALITSCGLNSRYQPDLGRRPAFRAPRRRCCRCRSSCACCAPSSGCCC